LLAPALLLLAACTEEVELPPIRDRSDSLVLRTPSDLPVCAGTFDAMEAEVLQIQEMFGSPPVTVDYSWMPQSHYTDEEFPCDGSTWGCAPGSHAYVRTLMSTHELMHASRSSWLPSVLEEGLAALHDPAQSRTAEVMASRAELLDVLEGGESNGYEQYERAAHFVSFLFAQYGRETFMKFEERVRWDTYAHRPLWEWKADFEAVYGDSFEQVWETYATYPDCAPAQFHLPLSVCSMLGTPTQAATLTPAFMEAPGAEATFTRALDCDDDEVVGPFVFYNGPLTRSAVYAIEIDNWLGGTVWLDLTGDLIGANRAILTNCGNCWTGSALFASTGTPSAYVTLQSGPYVLMLYRDFDTAGEFGITLSF
jgi:hypothetical protein